MRTTTTWVHQNWGEFKELVEVDDEIVVVWRRGRRPGATAVDPDSGRKPVAVAMPPDTWAAMAPAQGMNPQQLVELPSSEFRKQLSAVWRDAQRGTPSAAMYWGRPVLVVAPISVLPDDHADLQPEAEPE
ncbi:hypothetical protein [Amycolatopsis sp. NPDC051102]|uniref:hypothetical protein n=1 Tax=Amycolatopsis sp. NPDC051102 TaxID=3155163 RepID=UPI00342ADFEF